MLFRGIKHQVDKGPVDSVTGKAKYTLNDNRLLREDVEYRPLVREGGSQWERETGREGGRKRLHEHIRVQWCQPLVRMNTMSVCGHYECMCLACR